MSNKTVRIRTTPNGGDKYLKIKLEQDFDFIEVLSLKISQEEAYRNFGSDYGVVTGRVIINNGFGVPNAKVSVFIPIDEIDNKDPQMKGLYPFEVVSDKDKDGVRYNLFNKKSDSKNECFTPIGTFPSKRDFLDNQELSEVYSKYYKFTTTTNFAGDFMIFGVPVGTHIIHVDADISDIGIASQRPYDLISQGTNEKKFESSTKFKGGNNLDSLIQVKSSNIGVNVLPFWGEKDSYEVGVSRVDIDLNYQIKPSAIFMGSIFGDQEKNSINKNCRPRKNMGKLCEQATGEGTIEMIRYNTDGEIEQFDSYGEIDEDGAWAYQIPMNLDYMVTDEFGKLIPSDDPNIGIPTRSRVRFKIGMNQTGGEGRLRTRAKYLVPNNPDNIGEIDYEFGENTKDSSFRDLHWNKIYSISNYISRFQIKPTVSTNKITGGNVTGIKDVDGCTGDKNPFPFNKISTNVSPIFTIICLIITIIGFLIFVMNTILIPVINLIVKALNLLIKGWNSVVDAICKISDKKILGVRIFKFLKFMCDLHVEPIDYLPCLFVKCDEKVFAPGCNSKTAKNALIQSTGISETCHGKNNGIDLCGLPDCISFQLAKALNLFQMDFYNDWINGTLYSFLIKYKKRKRNKEKFCEYDCSDFGGDNTCSSNFLSDTCFGDKKNSQKESKSMLIREGLIKKIGNEFFYAATTHDAGMKLFATEIVNLGAVLKCDWQGIPKINEFLTPTTYNIPPETDEVDGNVVLETGQVQIGSYGVGLFFNIDCGGLHVTKRQCLNVRHICEFGVEIDENRLDEGGPAADGVIGISDLDVDDGDRPKWFRDVFLGLNINKNAPNLNYPFDSSFNLNDYADYDFANKNNNGKDYIDFRGYSIANTNVSGFEFGQFNNSYYFYFGTKPGKTSLDKMNKKFFSVCQNNENKAILKLTTTNITVIGNNDGSVTFNYLGEFSLIEYIITGPNGYFNSGVANDGVTTINNLGFGNYTIEIVEPNGNSTIKDFSIGNPQVLGGYAFVSKQPTNLTSNDGEITVNNIIGGVGPYNYSLFDSSCNLIYGPQEFNGLEKITGLEINDINSNCFENGYNGYTLKINDSVGNEFKIGNLIVSGPTQLLINVDKEDVLCFGGSNGKIVLNINGGLAPYDALVTGDDYSSNGLVHTNLKPGIYNIVVTDTSGIEGSSSITIDSLGEEMTIEAVDNVEEPQCDQSNHHVKFKVLTPWASSLVSIQYSLDFSGEWNTTFVSGYYDSNSILTLMIPKGSFSDSVDIRMVNNGFICSSNVLTYLLDDITIPPSNLSINIDSPLFPPLLQSTNLFVKFKFNISDYFNGNTINAPYTVKYTVTGINSVGSKIGTEQTTNITSNQQVITANVPNLANVNADKCIVKVKVKDKNGCESNTINININLP